MVQSGAKTVAAYLAELPADRRQAIEVVRQLILDNVDAGIEETMSYGMLGYCVPHRIFPAGYHCDPRQPLPYAGLASQKHYMSVYLMGLYIDADDARWFEKAWRAAGKKLDMGKSCVRFKRLDDLALDVLAEAFRRMPSRRYVAAYEATRVGAGKGGAPTKKATTKKAPAKQAPAKQPVARQRATAKAATARKTAKK